MTHARTLAAAFLVLLIARYSDAQDGQMHNLESSGFRTDPNMIGETLWLATQVSNWHPHPVLRGASQ